MWRHRVASIAIALALIVALLPIGQIGHAQDSLQAQAEAYFGAGPRTIEAAALFENLNDGDTDNDPYIISLRSAEDYAKGHIPGAVNMSVKELFSLDNLATIPPDRQVVVVCYTGQTAGQATAALNMLGYDAYSLLFGMSSWTTDPEVFVSRFDPEKHTSAYFVETEANGATGTYSLPDPLAVDVASAADAYFSAGPKTLPAADLFENLNDGDTDNDPYIVSLRSAEHYALGHIPGAVNMSIKEMFSAGSLATIPPDRQVVVVCYTGQSAGQATAALNMLGYEAYSLLHGMSSWTDDPEVYVNRFDPEKHANDFIIDTEAHLPAGPYDLAFSVAGPPAEAGEAVDLTAVAYSYFSEGVQTIQAVDLFENLNDGDTENDPYIISVRSAEDYAKGHVPGAVNMNVKEMFTLENLATIPPDRQVVVYCYTGQTAGQATAALNMLGYEAYSLAFGMSSWTTDPEVFVSRFDPEKHANDFIVETEPNEATGTYSLPDPLGLDAAAAAYAYFSGGPRTIAAVDLFENLNDGDTDNDPYIISVRTAEHYALGHVPGAVNYPLGEMFAPETLATIPPDRQLVVYCYTGQSAGQATAALNMLGYEAYSLLFGMSSWTADPEVFVSRFDPETRANDFIIDTEAHLPAGPYALPFTVAGPPSAAGEAVDLTAVAYSYFSEGVQTIQAVDLFENLNDGDTENDPYIISVRSAEDYAKGHVPGAVNMNVKEMFTLENLATIPPDRQVVVYCYTGQTAGQATAALNMLGYDAYSLHFGMSSWTTDPEVFVSRFDPEKHANDFIVETEPNEATGTYSLPDPLGLDVAGAADAYFGAGPKTLPAADLFENLNDGDTDNDPYIISVRSAEHYALGHVPGAVNYPLGEMFAPETLATIPPDRQLVVYCYTGQSAGQATAALNMLGYEAYSLLFGMSAWTTDPEVFVSRFDPETRANDFTIDTEAHLPGGPYELPFTVSGAEEPGEEPAEEAPAMVIPAQNCVSCHIDQGALQELAVEEEEVVSEASSGEG